MAPRTSFMMREENNFSGGEAEKIVTKGVAISGLGNLLLRLVDLLIAVLLLRWLSIFEYGLYRLILAAYDFGSSFYLGGLENVVVSDASGDLKKNTRQAQALFSVYFFFTLAVGIALFLFFSLGSAVLSQWIGVEAKHIWIISFLFLISPFEGAAKIRFNIFLDFPWGTAFKILRDLSRLGAVLVFYFFFSFGIEEALWSILISYGFPVLVVLLFYRRGSFVFLPAFFEINTSLRALFVRHGRWALFDDFLANSGRNIRPFIIKTFVGVEAVAIISVAQNLVAYTSSLLPIRDILTPVLPRFSGNKEDLKKQISRAAKYSIAANTILGIVAAALAPLFIWLFFPKYISSLPFFYLLLLGFPFHGFRSVLPPVFYALQEQRILFRLTAIRLIFTLFAGVLVTYLLGIWGAALEILLVGVVIIPAYTRALQKILPGWRFRLRDIVSFDVVDREFYRKIRDRILAKRRLLKTFLP